MNDIRTMVSDLSLQAYLAAPGVNSGFLHDLARSPAHAKYNLDQPKVATKAMNTGSLVDAMILDRIAMESEFVVRPDRWDDWRTNAAKEWRQEQESLGKTVVTPDEWSNVTNMVTALQANEKARDLLWADYRKAQMSVFWDDPETALRCKCRPDCITGNVIINLKSTSGDARAKAFSRTAEDFGYWLAAAHYLAGVQMVTGEEYYHCWVVVEQKPPYGVKVYSTHAEDGPSRDLDAAFEERRNLLHLAAQCMFWDQWPGYPVCIETLKRPKWANLET
jgi:exodeoxyribonuclease VIII